MEAIVQPLTIKGKTMKNRIVVAPAERVGLTYTDNIMGADVIREYETLAENNAGLIMTQSLVVAPEDAAAVGFPLPGIWKETQIAPLKDGHYEVAQHWENHLRWARQKFNKQFKEEMPQVTPHVCRHTFCSNMASLGMSPKTLQIIMGHASIEVTLNVYTHLEAGDIKSEFNRVVGTSDRYNFYPLDRTPAIVSLADDSPDDEGEPDMDWEPDEDD